MQLFQKTVEYTGYISKTQRLFGRNKIKISVSQPYKKGKINIFSLEYYKKSIAQGHSFKKRGYQ